MAHVVECAVCGHVGATKSQGSIVLTIVLLLFIFPVGVLYWLLSRSKGCSACGSKNIRLYTPRPVVKTISATPQLIQEQPTARNLNTTKLVSDDIFSYQAGDRVTLDSNGVKQKNCDDCMELIRFDAKKCKHCGSFIKDIEKAP